MNNEHHPDQQKPDIEETPECVRIEVSSVDPEVMFNPANLVFIALPRTWSLEEYQAHYNKPPNEAVLELINSKTPYMPGIKPYNAFVHFFNPIDFSSGAGLLSYNTLNQTWEAHPHNPPRIKNPHAFTDALAEKFGLQPRSKEEVEEAVRQMPPEEVAQDIFNEVVSSLPSILIGDQFKQPAVRDKVIEIMAELADINAQPDDSANYRAQLLYDQLKELFLLNRNESKLYRYGHVMVMTAAQISDNNSQQGWLLLK